jgi:hypothetical protein
MSRHQLLVTNIDKTCTIEQISFLKIDYPMSLLRETHKWFYHGNAE